MAVFFFPIHYLEYNFGYVAATSNGEESSTVAAFDHFLYEDDNK